MLDQALSALAAGDVDRLISYFRYFEDSKRAQVKDGMKELLTLMRDRMGKP